MGLKWQNFVLLRGVMGLEWILFSNLFTCFALLGSNPGLVRQGLYQWPLFPFWFMLQQDRYWEMAMNSGWLRQEVAPTACCNVYLCGQLTKVISSSYHASPRFEKRGGSVKGKRSRRVIVASYHRDDLFRQWAWNIPTLEHRVEISTLGWLRDCQLGWCPVWESMLKQVRLCGKCLSACVMVTYPVTLASSG